jgi:hypothetical protein
MPPARPLRDLFAELTGGIAGDAAQVLAQAGHPDLPAGLVAEAVVSYADTAAPEVAEHLAPFVMAHSSVPTVDSAGGDPLDWLDALATAPAVPVPEADLDLDFGEGQAHDAATSMTGAAFDLDFGQGAEFGHDWGTGTHDAQHAALDWPDEPPAGQHDEFQPGHVDVHEAFDPGHIDPGHIDPGHIDPEHHLVGLDDD